jgi:putative oxidoreductase
MNSSSTTSAHNIVAVNEPALRKFAALVGRILLSALFLISGLGKIGNYAGTAAFMSSVGVPSALLPLVIATEVLGSVAIIIGWRTRVAAILLAGFSLLTALVFHHNFADQTQTVEFLKDVSIAGALLLLAVNGAGTVSLDHRRVG